MSWSGWSIWQPKPPKEAQDAPPASLALDDHQQQESNEPTSAATPSPRKLTRDEAAYEELKTLFSSVDPEATTRAAAVARVQATKEPTDYSDSIYPSTMSCSQCFDQAYYCSSVGGQLNNVYRYGALRSCSDLWAQWRFCMRTKGMGEEEKKRRIREFNQKKVAKYKVGRSSEDVWEIRGADEMVEQPFSRSPDSAEATGTAQGLIT